GASGRLPHVPPRRRPIHVRGEIPGSRRRGRNSRAGGTVTEKAGLTRRRRPGRWPQFGGWLLILSGSAAPRADALRARAGRRGVAEAQEIRRAAGLPRPPQARREDRPFLVAERVEQAGIGLCRWAMPTLLVPLTLLRR